MNAKRFYGTFAATISALFFIISCASPSSAISDDTARIIIGGGAFGKWL